MQIGDVIDGKYQLIRELGRGGMGAVFEGRHVTIGRRAALKLLNPEVAGNPDMVSRFLREAQAAAAIGSDHIVDIYDVGQLPEGAPYLVMEYLEGQPLADAIRQTGRFQVPVAVGIILQLCEALTPAHERGIVHRDIKPANLFLTTLAGREGWLKVLDFGIAKVLNAALGQSEAHLTRTGMTLGTPFYMAPEQFMGAKDVDLRADVYSAGVILYQMLAGETPFLGSTYEELIVKVAAGNPRSPVDLRPDLDPSLSAIVLQSMSRDADARFPSMGALANALRPYSDQALGASIPLTLAAPAEQVRSTIPSPGLATPMAGIPETAYTPSQANSAPGVMPETAYTPVGAPTPNTPIGGPANPQSLPPGVYGTYSDHGYGQASQPGPQDWASSSGNQRLAPGVEPTPQAWESASSGGSSSKRWLIPAIGGAVVLLLAVAGGVVVLLSLDPDDPEPEPVVSPSPQETQTNTPNETVASTTGTAASENEGQGASSIRWVRIEPALPDTLLGLPVEMTDSEDRGFRATRRITAPTYPYEIQQHEVTWEELRPWLAEHPDHQVTEPDWLPDEANEQYPATGVPWPTAIAYCRSLGGTLPSEEEWEYAARGTERRPYPWGSQSVDLARTHVYRSGPLSRVMSNDQDVTPGAATSSVFDLLGNAQEWTADLWREDHPGQDEGWVQQGEMSARAVRGLPPAGEAPSSLPRFGAAYRMTLCATGDCPSGTAERMVHIGFRCSRRSQ